MSETNGELYEQKVDVGMLNTVKIYWADVSSVNPSSLLFAFFSDEGRTLQTPAQ